MSMTLRSGKIHHVQCSMRTIGNFWVDVTRCTLYVLLPTASSLRTGPVALATASKDGNESGLLRGGQRWRILFKVRSVFMEFLHSEPAAPIAFKSDFPV